MSGLDPNIILSGLAQQGPLVDPARVQQMQQNALALQQQRKQGQQQNALAKVFQNPKSFTNGMLTPQGMQEVFAIDPQTGMQLQQQGIQTQDLQAKTIGDQHQYITDNIATPAMEAYEQALKTMPQAQALQVGQQVYTDGLNQARGSGIFSADQIAMMSPQFNPTTTGAGLESYSDYQKNTLDQQKLSLAADYDSGKLRQGAAALDVRAQTAGVSDPLGLGGLSFSDGSSLPLAPSSTANAPSNAASAASPSGGSVAPVSAAPSPPVQHPSASQASSQSVAAPAQPSTPAQQPMPTIPGYTPAGSKQLYKTATETGKMPNFGGGNIGRRQQEAFENGLASYQANNANSDAADPQVQALAESMANYSIAPPSDQAMGRYPLMRDAYLQAQKLNPALSAENYPAQVAAIKAFDTGPQGNAVASLDVGIQHLKVLQQAADALNNGSMPAFNKLAQSYAEQTGSDVPTNFDTTKQLVGDEIAKAIVGGPTAQADREKAQDILDKANSPQQLQGAINQIMKLMGGQLNGKRQQFMSSTRLPGSVFDAKLLPDALQQLQGANDSVDNTGGSSPAGGGQILHFDAQGNLVQ